MREFHAIVLAAGMGLRFGGQKLLALFGSGLLIDGALNVALAAPVESVTLVTGADADNVADAARLFAAKINHRVDFRVVCATDYREGLAASLRAGLEAQPDTAFGTFIFLADMPRIPVSILPALARALLPPEILAVAPVCKHRRGHPVLLSNLLRPQLMRLTGDVGAKGILDQLGSALALIPTDHPGVLVDVDVVGDLSVVERMDECLVNSQRAC